MEGLCGGLISEVGGDCGDDIDWGESKKDDGEYMGTSMVCIGSGDLPSIISILMLFSARNSSMFITSQYGSSSSSSSSSSSRPRFEIVIDFSHSLGPEIGNL